MLLALALALLVLPAYAALAGSGEAEALEQGSTYRSGVTDYYVVTDPGSRNYTDSTLPSTYLYIDCPTIKSRAFANCTRLSEVIFSSQVKTVGDEAFMGCTGLFSVEARGVETIGSYAFASSSLYYIGFSGKLTSLGSHAFDGCYRLSSFSTWSTKLTSFGDCVFKGTALTAIDLRGIESVSSTAFSGLNIRAQVAATGQEVLLPDIATVYIEDRSYINSISASATDISVGVRTSGYRAVVQDLQGNDVNISESINYPWYSFTIPYEAGGVYVVSALSYTITFPDSMGLDPVVLVSGAGSVQLPQPDIEGMTGWTLDGSTSFWSISETTASSVGRTVAVRALIPDLVETYDHSAIADRTDVSLLATRLGFLPGDSLATLPDVVGYEFVGWEIDGTEYQAGDEIPSYQSHTARSLWAATITYTVSYPAIGLEETVEYGAPYSVTPAAVQEADSQRFVGWSVEGEEGTYAPADALEVAGDIVLVPVFDARAPFTVKLVDGETAILESTVYDGRTYTVSAADPAKDFCAFRHWDLDGQAYVRGDSFEVSADTTLTAVWFVMPTSTVTYHVGDDVVTYTYLAGYPMTIYCAVQPAEGMVLSGWSVADGSDDVAHANGSTVSLDSDIDLYPVWAVGDRITVTFHGTVDGDVSVAMIPGKTIEVTQTAPEVEHHTFLGWALSASTSAADFELGSEIPASGDMDLYPLYEEDLRASLTHVTHEGSATVVVYAGETVAVGTGEEPVRDGYSFSGWRDAASSAVYGDGDSLAVTQDTILVAEWTPVPDTITLTFHGTTEGDVSVVMVPGDVAEVNQTAPAIEHFQFLGWSASDGAASACFGIGSEIAAFGDIDLYPLYEEDSKAKVTHITHTGSTSATVYAGTTVTVGTGTAPARSGYTFSGWWDAVSSEVYANGEDLTVTRDTILVAEWTPVPATPVPTQGGAGQQTADPSQQSGSGAGGSQSQAPSSESSSSRTHDRANPAPSAREDPTVTVPEEPPAEEAPATDLPSADDPDAPAEVPYDAGTPAEDGPETMPAEAQEKKGNSSAVIAAVCAVTAAAGLGCGLVLIRRSRAHRETT